MNESKPKPVCIVTGAAGNIGSSVARRFRASGYHVVGIDLAAPEHAAPDSIVYCDLSVKGEVEKTFSQIAKSAGNVECLVNCAAVFREGSVTSPAESDVDSIVDANIKSIVWTTAAAAGIMEQGATIVNLASVAAFVSLPGTALYDMSKAALVAYSRASALELGPRGIRVNCLCPGFVTEGMRDEPRDSGVQQVAAILQTSPSLPTPEQVAECVYFLASPFNLALTGAVLNLDGGLTAGYPAALLEALGPQ